MISNRIIHFFHGTLFADITLIKLRKYHNVFFRSIPIKPEKDPSLR
jgi:hypothetical protein